MTKTMVELIVIATVFVTAAFITGLIIGYNRSAAGGFSDIESRTTPHSHTYTHESREVTEPYPSLAFALIPDQKMGWNIFLETENFIFTPQDINTEYVAGEGHAHLYINGERKTRLYGESYYLRDLSPGTNIISVTLSGNDHSELYMNGELITASQTILVD